MPSSQGVLLGFLANSFQVGIDGVNRALAQIAIAMMRTFSCKVQRCSKAPVM